MKRCPSCDKTFEDSYRFCQQDGTPLVEADPPADSTPALDPYATMVGGPPIKPLASEPKPPEILTPAGESSSSISAPSDSPSPGEKDPLRTMYVSEAEMREALAAHDTPLAPPKDEPPASISEPEPPKFSEPEFSKPSSDWSSPPPSPFANEDPAASFSTPEPKSSSAPDPTDFHQMKPPIPSPFDAPKTPMFDPISAAPPLEPEPAAPDSSRFEPPPFEEPPTVIQKPPFSSSSEPPAASWTPPEPPVASWQNQEVGSNTPFNPPPEGTGAPSQGLAIGALVCGVLSCLCCVPILTGPAGIIMGFIARKKAMEDPANFGGAGLALGGMIAGSLGVIGFVVLIILQIFFGVLSTVLR